MRALLPITTDDLPPHIQDLRTAELSLFIVRGDALAGELTITSLAHTASGQTVTTSEVTTSGGIISTRRPAGATLAGAAAPRPGRNLRNSTVRRRFDPILVPRRAARGPGPRDHPVRYGPSLAVSCVDPAVMRPS
jgi:hypothetical protein